jgi:hypothetical protein
MMAVTLTPEEAKKLVTVLSVFIQENQDIVIYQESKSGIGKNTYVKVHDGEATDITDYGAW